METEQLRVFIVVAWKKSISTAASDLTLSQPAVTRMIQRLESELNVQLFDRGVRPLALTASGTEFLKFAEHTINQLDVLTQNLHHRASQIRGKFNICASTTTGEFIVPRLLHDFLGLFPKVEPRVVIMNSNAVLANVLRNQFNLGFVGAPRIWSPLTLIKVATDEIFLAVHEDHPLSREQKPIDLSLLRHERLVVREGGSGTYRMVQRRLKELGLVLPPHHTAMILGSTRAILSAVKDGVGCGFVSSLALNDTGVEGVKSLRIKDLNLRRNLYMAYKESDDLNPITSEFARFARSIKTIGDDSNTLSSY